MSLTSSCKSRKSSSSSSIQLIINHLDSKGKKPLNSGPFVKKDLLSHLYTIEWGETWRNTYKILTWIGAVAVVVLEILIVKVAIEKCWEPEKFSINDKLF